MTTRFAMLKQGTRLPALITDTVIDPDRTIVRAGATALLLAWLLTVAVLPSHQFFVFFQMYDEKRLFQVGLLIVTGIIFLLRASFTLGCLDRPTFLALALAVVLGVTSALLASVVSYALAEVAVVYLLIAAICILSVAFIETRDRLWPLYLPLVMAGAFLYGSVILGFSLGDSLNGHYAGWPLKIHNFSNPRFLNQWQSWLLPLFPALLMITLPNCRPAFRILIVFLAFGMLWAMLWYSLGRAALYAQAGVLIAIPLLFGRQGLRWAGLHLAVAATGVLLAAGVLAFNIFSPPIDVPIDRLANYSSWSRTFVWGINLKLVSEFPLLGMGPMHFASIQNYVAAHPHNLPLQLAVEWGIPASLAFGFAVLWAFFHWLAFARKFIKNSNVSNRERLLVISLTASMLAAGAHSLLSGIGVMPMSQMMFVIVLGLALGIYRQHHPVPGRADVRHWAVPIGLATVIASMAMAVFTVREAYRLPGYQEQGHPMLVTHAQPRFWQQGNLFHLMSEDPRVFTPPNRLQMVQDDLRSDLDFD